MTLLRWAILAFILLGAGLVAWAVASRPGPIEVPEKITLLSIDGNAYKAGEEPKTPEHYREYPLLGKVEITDAGQREEIMRALQRGISEGTDFQAFCFWPRHTVLTEQHGHTREYIVCFECTWVAIYEDGNHSRTVTTSTHAKELFNRTLMDAGVPLAPERKH
jgi:hypothetical protein